VTILAKGGRALTETQEIRLERYADSTEVNRLQIGDMLADGDLLSALAPDLSVELTCPRGTLLHLTGPFRTVVSLPEGADCGLEPLSGGLDVLTDQPTEIRSAGKTLGTTGTRYAVRLSRSESAPNCRVLVFEGHVEVKGADLLQVVSSAQSLTFSRQTVKPEPQPVTREEVQKWAGLYARFDLVKAEAAGVELTAEQRSATEVTLTKLHAAVLTAPTATQPRLDLAREQLHYRIGDEALYNLRRTELIDPGRLQQIQPEKLQRNDPGEYRRLDQILREIPPDVHRFDVQRKPVEPPPPSDQRFGDLVSVLATQEEIPRWAGLYARSDLAKAEAAGVELTGEQQEATEAELTRLHAAVLSDPTATQPRLDLAREQLHYRAGDEALYNLQRAQAIDPDKLKQIQPEKLQRNDPIEYNRLDQILRENPLDLHRFDSQKKPAEPPPQSDQDLERWLAAKRFGDVVSVLEARGSSGPLSSRDSFLLAKGYLGLGKAERALLAALQALERFKKDGLLNGNELAACRGLLNPK